MARASISTWLGLDTWAELMQINPLFFNNLYIAELIAGDACSQLYPQFVYQNPLNVSREEIAQAIYTAERNIANYLGFNLIPDWVCNERVQVGRARVPEGFPVMHNVRGEPSSVIVQQSKRVLSGGVRALEELVLGTLIKREDLDGDGYDETASVRYSCPWPVDPDEPPPCTPLLITFDTCEIKAYYSGHNGDREWEIKPTKVVYDGQLVTLYFKSWQIVAEEYTLGAFIGDWLHDGIDATDNDNYLEAVDLYREYNDTSEQATLFWNSPTCGMCGGAGCPTCLASQSPACLTVRDARRGILAYQAATYNDELDHWESACYSGRAPDYALINYYAGYTWACACPNNRMPPNLERAVAIYAASLLPRDVCDCDNAESFINSWREDLGESGGEGGTSHMLTNSELTNPFGLKRGAIEAYRIISSDATLKVSR